MGQSVPDWLGRALEDGLAGVVYFAQNINQDDAGQPARLSAQLRGIRPDLLIGIDEEGGNVTRLESARGSSLPGHAQLGRNDDVAATRSVGRMIGSRVALAGANVVLAPVADVNTNPANPVIGVRAFGAETELVSRHVAAMVRGLQDMPVSACVKHFPGHGDTRTDSHLELPRLELSWAEIERHHLPPFVAAVEVGVRAVMTAHIVVPELGELPATLNPRILATLRDTGFTGTIVTDALDMAAIRESFGAGQGAVLAMLAGADLLCIGNPSNPGPERGRTADLNDYLEVRGALLDALDEGILTGDALERAAESASLLAHATGNASDTAISHAAISHAAILSTAISGAARSDAQDAAESARIVRVACSRRGVVTLPQKRLTVLDLRGRATLAVGSAAAGSAAAGTPAAGTPAAGTPAVGTPAVGSPAAGSAAVGSLAVGLPTDVFSAALARTFEVDRVSLGQLGGSGSLAETLAATVVHAAGIPAESGVIVLVDRIAAPGAQRDAISRIAGIRPDALVVNAGLPVPNSDALDALALARIDCLAASRISAETVRRILRGEVA